MIDTMQDRSYSRGLGRDCQGFQNPWGSGVRVQEGRVWVRILYPHETLTLARGQGVYQGYVKGMYKKEILLFCNIFDQKSLVFFLQKIFLAFIKAYYMALEC
jgi:hypothetical protein